MTLQKIGEQGLTKSRIRYRIEDIITNNKSICNKKDRLIQNFDALQKFVAPIKTANAIELDFISPLELKQNGSALKSFCLRTFISALLRRIGNLSFFYLDKDCEIDYKGLISHAENNVSIVEDNMKLIPKERYNNRQKQSMQIGGLVGSVRIEGELNPLIPYIALGEKIHIGKKTSFGNGKYNIMG